MLAAPATPFILFISPVPRPPVIQRSAVENAIILYFQSCFLICFDLLLFKLLLLLSRQTGDCHYEETDCIYRLRAAVKQLIWLLCAAVLFSLCRQRIECMTSRLTTWELTWLDCADNILNAWSQGWQNESWPGPWCSAGVAASAGRTARLPTLAVCCCQVYLLRVLQAPTWQQSDYIAAASFRVYLSVLDPRWQACKYRWWRSNQGRQADSPPRGTLLPNSPPACSAIDATSDLEAVDCFRMHLSESPTSLYAAARFTFWVFCKHKVDSNQAQ